MDDPRFEQQFDEGDRVMQRDFSGIIHKGMGGVVRRAWKDPDDGIWRYYVAWDVGHAGTCTSRILRGRGAVAD
jgi:hypothetical protein